MFYKYFLQADQIVVAIYKLARYLRPWKVVIDRVRQVFILWSVNTTKYYLGGLASSCYGEVVVL